MTPMENSESVFPALLLERLWHTTTPERYASIRGTGSILAEPPLADAEPWKTSRGPKFYPYARVLSGVSLFDFREFNPDVYSARYPMASWRTFVPYRTDKGSAVWLEIDRDLVPDRYIDPPALVTKWKYDGRTGTQSCRCSRACKSGRFRSRCCSSVLVGAPKPTFVELSVG